LRPTSPRKFRQILPGAKFIGLARRGKYLLFQLHSRSCHESITLLGHLGMTGRIYLARKNQPLPKHAAVVLDLGDENLVYEDTRYFGRLTLDTAAVKRLGPEPLGDAFDRLSFARLLKRSRQAIKIKLLDQTLVAGIGNIYASEALFRARISPRRGARHLSRADCARLVRSVRAALQAAIRAGGTTLRDYVGTDGNPGYFRQRLYIYERAGRPCRVCGTLIRRITQAQRSTYYCPRCQH
jgi:formamidopyrimidine-DNA glycosylase